MKNPFNFGEAVIGEQFCNRQKEIKDITQCIHAAQDIFIYADRRAGKTSLIEHVLHRLDRQEDIVTIWVDVHKASSSIHFLEVYASAIARALVASKTKLEKIASFFTRVMPSFKYNPDGGVSFSFEFSKTKTSVDRALEEVFDLPQVIAQKKCQPVVVVFDEFQEITNFNGAAFEKKLRAFIQHHREVCYIFLGSKTHVILDMFSDANRAFYKSGMIYPLGKIPEGEWQGFVVGRFATIGKVITPELVSKIYKLAAGIPYYMQMICYLICGIADKEVGEKDVELAKDEVMHLQGELFYSWYDSCSAHQRACLVALSQATEIFSNDVRLTYNLGPVASVQTSVKALMRGGLVHKEGGKYRLTDPFFRRWLGKQMKV